MLDSGWGRTENPKSECRNPREIRSPAQLRNSERGRSEPSQAGRPRSPGTGIPAGKIETADSVRNRPSEVIREGDLRVGAFALFAVLLFLRGFNAALVCAVFAFFLGIRAAASGLASGESRNSQCERERDRSQRLDELHFSFAFLCLNRVPGSNVSRIRPACTGHPPGRTGL